MAAALEQILALGGQSGNSPLRGVNLRLLPVTMGPPLRVNTAPEEGREEGKRDLPAHLTICFHPARFLLGYEYCAAKRISRLDGKCDLHQASSNLTEPTYSNAPFCFKLLSSLLQ